MRGEPLAALIDLVLVAVQQSRAGMFVDGRRHPQQGVAGEGVVMVEEGDIIAVGGGQGVVTGARDMAVVAPPGEDDTRVACRRLVEQGDDRRIAGGVVANTELPIGVGLVADRGDGRRQQVWRRVMHRQDHRNARAVGEAVQPRRPRGGRQTLVGGDPALIMGRHIAPTDQGGGRRVGAQPAQAMGQAVEIRGHVEGAQGEGGGDSGAAARLLDLAKAHQGVEGGGMAGQGPAQRVGFRRCPRQAIAGRQVEGGVGVRRVENQRPAKRAGGRVVVAGAIQKAAKAGPGVGGQRREHGAGPQPPEGARRRAQHRLGDGDVEHMRVFGRRQQHGPPQRARRLVDASPAAQVKAAAGVGRRRRRRQCHRARRRPQAVARPVGAPGEQAVVQPEVGRRWRDRQNRAHGAGRPGRIIGRQRFGPGQAGAPVVGAVNQYPVQ